MVQPSCLSRACPHDLLLACVLAFITVGERPNPDAMRQIIVNKDGQFIDEAHSHRNRHSLSYVEISRDESGTSHPIVDDLKPWWKPRSLMSSMIVAAICPVGWAVYHILARVASIQDVNHAHFFFDYLVGVALCSTILFCIPGEGHWLASSDLDVLTVKVASAVMAGIVDVVGNFFLTMAIAQMVLSFTTTVCMAGALAVGASLTYIADPRGDKQLILLSVGLSMMAVGCNSIARDLERSSAMLKRDGLEAGMTDARVAQSESRLEAKPPETTEVVGAPVMQDETKPDSNSPTNTEFPDSKSIRDEDKPYNTGAWPFLLLISVCVGSWAPLAASSMMGANKLSPYGSFACVCIGYCSAGVALLVAQQGGLLFRIHPQTSFNQYIEEPFLAHILGIGAGCVWAAAGQAYALGGNLLGYTSTFIVGQASPLITVAAGVIWFGDFDNAPIKALTYLVMSVLFYLAAVIVIAFVTNGSYTPE